MNIKEIASARQHALGVRNYHANNAIQQASRCARKYLRPGKSNKAKALIVKADPRRVAMSMTVLAIAIGACGTA
eukprot:3645608-Pleurochrysis_carterae.AAC.2